MVKIYRLPSFGIHRWIGKIKDHKTSDLKYNILKGDLFSKISTLFMCLKNSKYGFFIFQKKENHGVKVALKVLLNAFMRLKNLWFYFELKQAPARYLIRTF
jgi:hypothetical protein